MLINKTNIKNYLYIFVSIHLIIWVLVPYLTNKNLPLDTIEAIAWGSNLDWGFNKHPPMSAFFSEIFYKVFGPTDWAYYLLSQIFVVFTFIVVFKLSEEIFSNKILCFLSILLLEGIYFYNFTSPEFNVNVCQLPFWALTVYYSWKVFNKKQFNIKNCLLLGIVAAAGFLSKYLFMYLLISIDLLFLYLIFIKKDRKFDFKYIIPSATFIILLIPHIIWLFDNDFITIFYGLARTGIDNPDIFDNIKFPIIFLLKQIGIIIPFLILIFLLIKKIKLKLNFKDKKLIFLLSVNLLPIFLIFLTSFVLGSKIRTMWMTPFYLFFGILFVYIFQDQIKIKKIKNFLAGFIILFFLSPISYAYISITKNDKRTDYPGKEIAKKVQKLWDEDFNDTINVVLGNEWKAGNLSYHLKSRPVWEGNINQEKLDGYNKFICIDDICVGNK